MYSVRICDQILNRYEVAKPLSSEGLVLKIKYR